MFGNFWKLLVSLAGEFTQYFIYYAHAREFTVHSVLYSIITKENSEMLGFS